MFGFSLPKLLFTAITIALVIYGFRWIGRLQQINEQRLKERKNPRKQGDAAASAQRRTSTVADADDIETMIACKVCGSYVAAGSARSCGSDDCPYPG